MRITSDYITPILHETWEFAGDSRSAMGNTTQCYVRKRNILRVNTIERGNVGNETKTIDGRWNECILPIKNTILRELEDREDWHA